MWRIAVTYASAVQTVAADGSGLSVGLRLCEELLAHVDPVDEKTATKLVETALRLGLSDTAANVCKVSVGLNAGVVIVVWNPISACFVVSVASVLTHADQYVVRVRVRGHAVV